MFPRRYYAGRMFAQRYFPESTAAAVVETGSPDQTFHARPRGEVFHSRPRGEVFHGKDR